jgi:hypothetical protein
VAVESKCTTCAELEVEGEGLNHEGTHALSKLYGYHSMTFRNQRAWYHDVREKAHQEPTDNPKVHQLMFFMLLILSHIYNTFIHTLYLSDDFTNHGWCCSSAYIYPTLRQIRCVENTSLLPILHCQLTLPSTDMLYQGLSLPGISIHISKG